MKKLSLCLAFILILTMIPIGAMIAFAEGNTAEPWELPGVGTYDTLQKAVDAVDETVDNATIILTDNLTEAVSVDLKGKTLTIEGKNLGTAETPVYPTITVGAATAIAVGNGTVTLENINAVSSGSSTTATLVLTEGADVTLNNVTFTNTAGAAISNSNTTEAVQLTLMGENSRIEGTARNGIEVKKDTAKLTFTMYAGTVHGGNNYGLSGNSTNAALDATIYGGTVYGKQYAMTGANLTATVYGGEFSVGTASNNIIHTNGTYTILGGTFKNGKGIGGLANIDIPQDSKTLTLTPVMLDDASIYTYGEQEGIRFNSTINTQWLSHLATKFGANKVEYGTMICPKDLFEDKEDFSDFILTNTEDVKVVIAATPTGTKTEGADTVISAALMNLKPGNEARDFAARTYIKITNDADVYYVYSDNVTVTSMDDLLAN